MSLDFVEFKQRRDKVLEKINANSVVIVAAGKNKYRNNDIEYPFRQNSNFYYLTGFLEADAVLVLSKDNRENTGKFILFCQPNDEIIELWHGKRIGVEAVKTIYGADEAYALNQIDQKLPEILQGKVKLYYLFSEDLNFVQQINVWLNQAKQTLKSNKSKIVFPEVSVDLAVILHELRVYKSAGEIEKIRCATKISALAHQQLMRKCRSGMMERQLAAEFIYYIMQNGCSDIAYQTIVGGGDNACTLHYAANNAVLQDGDLVLVDAGGEYELYAADITRTFPINGKFTATQAAIYNLVLAAQQQGIAQIYPGNTWDKIQAAIIEIIVNGLIALEILHGDPQELIQNKSYQSFYMHSSGHWLGLDTHDVGKYCLDGEYRKLESGMILTVEPGLYFAKENTKVAEKWRGIGVRIEDDILVTANGYEVLTKDAPKTILEIEALMAK